MHLVAAYLDTDTNAELRVSQTVIRYLVSGLRLSF